MRLSPIVLLAFLGLPAPSAPAVPRPAAPAPEAIAANDNHRPAGHLERGVLTLQLEVRAGLLHTEEDSGPALPALAFGEVGGPLQVPGPLIRVPQGTEVRVSIRNPLDSTLTIYGLGPRPARSDSGLVLRPGEIREIRFRAGTPGTWYYWGAFRGLGIGDRRWLDSQLAGALVVDPPAPRPTTGSSCSASGRTTSRTPRACRGRRKSTWSSTASRGRTPSG